MANYSRVSGVRSSILSYPKYRSLRASAFLANWSPLIFGEQSPTSKVISLCCFVIFNHLIVDCFPHTLLGAWVRPIILMTYPWMSLRGGFCRSNLLLLKLISFLLLCTIQSIGEDCFVGLQRTQSALLAMTHYYMSLRGLFLPEAIFYFQANFFFASLYHSINW